MPVTWNSETEAKLLAGLFKVCDIRVNGEQLKRLAEMIGPECTPKAVTHRLAKFRTQAGAFNGGSKSKSTESTPVKRNRGSAKKTPKDEQLDQDFEDDSDGLFGRDYAGSAKKVKKEAKEEAVEDELIFKEE